MQQVGRYYQTTVRNCVLNTEKACSGQYEEIPSRGEYELIEDGHEFRRHLEPLVE